ncbi:OTU domain-containing protein 5-A isoform X2 [Anopheles coustani]|uniref:OTU domain-containing protein 5-A isoform X2 n=1 Tax=Anopheles coustani TaxID=139045 RepID=UPI00265B0D1F|nr:OTU domain-containing protein 5-A isoform X2 [Anopheles coustani]
MTIKPVVNQKSAKEETQEGTSQSVHGVGNAGVRAAHRNVVLNQLSSSESQALPREKRGLTPHNFDNESVVRHRRSPHKNLGRLKRDHYHKRESRERDKTAGSPSYHHHVLQPSASGKTSSCSSPLAGSAGGCRSPKASLQAAGTGSSLLNGHTGAVGNVGASGADLNAVIEEALSGYNSGDEHIGQKDAQLTPDEWQKRDEAFAKVLSDRGFILQEMEEDGACLFRAISLQVYGDQDMHEVIRQQTMDYIYQNREYFAQFVTEDIAEYVKRKRANHVHGNHIEIQAMSEMYNRSVELYCYQSEPINIFNSDQINNGNEPLRLSYQRCSHYNAIVNPYKASVGVGLGLAGYRPDEGDIKQVADAVRMSEELEIEKTMFEDKLKTTDWEATNEAIEEQIARESYLQWCRDNMRNGGAGRGGSGGGGVGGGGGGGSSQNMKSTSSTITSTEMMAACASGSQSFSGHGGLMQAAQQQQTASSYLLELRKSPSATLTAGGGGVGLAGGDRGACSSSSSKNSSFELDCSPPSPAQCSSQDPTGGCDASYSMQQQQQQQYYFSTDATTTTTTATSANTNTGNTSNNTMTCSGEGNRRKKRNLNSPIEKAISCEMKKCKANSNRTASASSSPLRPESPVKDQMTKASSPPSTSSSTTSTQDSNGGSGSGLSTPASSTLQQQQQQQPPLQPTRDETPMSEFYQSLLESSYTDDGFGQLSEREMIQKALEESAMDFVKRCDGSKTLHEDKYGTTDEEYDSPSP